jgi:non-heme Fe2+,alpha-ketoglutarate-dependent halogenase
MGKHLTSEQIDAFRRDGFVFPIDVLGAEELARIADRIAAIEAEAPTAFAGENRNNAHLAYDFLDEIVHHPRIADAVEDLIGPDILAMSTVIFDKPARSKGYVSWHQDGRYTALSDATPVTAWVALTDSTVENGAMRMAPGTHLGDFLEHEDTFAEDNILTRGQNIATIDESEAVAVTLKAGQMSLHHWKVAHASGPNETDARRIGFAVQAYIKPETRQTEGRGFAQLVRGEDRHGHMRLLPRVGDLPAKEALRLRDETNRLWLDQLYDGAATRRSI